MNAHQRRTARRARQRQVDAIVAQTNADAQRVAEETIGYEMANRYVPKWATPLPGTRIRSPWWMKPSKARLKKLGYA